ncbi:MAG: DHHW family protein [Ruminococcus sp.]|nr:DHHW family protein [Ruminococcus sp.]
MSSVKENNGFQNYLPMVVFLIFIFGMGIWFIFAPKSDYSSNEKRYLQEFPEVSLDKVTSGEFGTDFESFFADQFPSRDMWVGFNAYYSLYTGNNGANGVYNCNNGYLINKPVSAENNLDKNIDVICDFASKCTVPVSMMLVPSTGYVANDVLPTIHNSYNDDSYFDNISKKLANNKISFVDLRSAFKNEHSSGNQLYYKTDHHWTTSGAYVGYMELCKQLGINAVEKKNFKIEQYDNFYGTTFSTSGFWNTQPDKIEVWKNPNNTEDNISVKITEGLNTTEYNTMYFYDHLKNDDKYPVFVDGNHALTEITNTNATGGTILMIKDSFSHSIAPFLAENYSKVIMVDMRYYKDKMSTIIEKENPEQILFMYGIDNLATDGDIVWLEM